MSRDSRPISVGDILRSRYRLEAQIGRGGMGVVYRATDLELMREVAVKVINEDSSADARERLVREARAAAALNHPNIISVYDVGEENGTPFFVMELVHGSSLGKERGIELPRIVELASQICAALEHAHGNEIVHRDLKPDNVLISGHSNTVKLADLGLALPGYGARISRAGLVVGTPSYMAPEQAMGQKVDARTDLYALGVLLYELTTGRLPFTGEDPLTIVSQHVHAPVVRPRVLRPKLPRAFEAVILRLLEKNPDARFSSAKETALALQQSLEATDGDEETEAVAAVAILDALSRGRMVGRTVELDEARQLWRRALEGHGHAVLLSGEPGAGKTRLAREVTIQAGVDGAFVLSGSCYEYEATTPYLPFVEAFRRWVRDERDNDRLCSILCDDAPQIAKLVPELEKRLGPFPKRSELPPHEERLLFFDAVAHVFSKLAQIKGVLFFADDLHWADRGTLWLLGHLLRQLRDERVLIVGCYRETELDRAHPLARALLDWNRERLATRMSLRRFDAAETNAQLSALLGENISAEFGEAVHRETEGNPFFVEEVLKALIEQGSVRRESGRWKRCDVGDLVIPQSVKEAIGNRLDRVGEQSNEVLRVAAVLGKTFSFEELQAAANDATEDALLDALDEAVNAQLIATSGGDSFAFTHDKIREVLYEELNPIRRRRLHRHAAEGLERHGVMCERERQGIMTSCSHERLAYHYIQAGDYEKGLKYAKGAAAAAESVFAFDEVIAAYKSAFDCAESLGLVDEQLSLQEAIGKSYLLHGDLIPAAEHFESAMSLTSDSQVRARLQVQAAQSLVANGNQRGVEYLHEALKVLDPVEHPLETANALANEARFHHLAGRHRKAIELLTRAAELIEPVISSNTFSPAQAPMISQIYPYLAGAHQHYGLFEDSNEWARRAMALGERLNISFTTAMGWEFLGENAIHLGEYAQGLEYSEREREIVERIHSRERRAWTHFVAGMCAWRSGDSARSDREYTEGIAIAEATGERRVGNLLKGNYAEFKAFEGVRIGRETPAGQKLLDEALALALQNYEADHDSPLLYSRFESHRCLASVRFSRGELSEAEELASAALDFVWGTESRVTQMWIGPLYMDVLIAAASELKSQGKLSEADEKLDRAREIVRAYRELVSLCQSPHYVREADRLEQTLAQ